MAGPSGTSGSPWSPHAIRPGIPSTYPLFIFHPNPKTFMSRFNITPHVAGLWILTYLDSKHVKHFEEKKDIGEKPKAFVMVM
jgi:hypothetical protein